MKKSVFYILLISSTLSNAQVGIGTIQPSPASMLEINGGDVGSYRGFLPPRVPNDAARDAINATSEDTGLMVFVLDTGCLDFWNGLEWENVYCTGGEGDVWINEFHYTDVLGVNFIELAGIAGTELSGYYVAKYNGDNGLPTEIVTFSGVLPNEENGFGTSFKEADLQNSLDGFALIDPDGKIIQFLSYEGDFNAVGGPANGLTSEDVGVQETNASESIHLTGVGNSFSDFTWSISPQSTPGSKNIGQTFN